jgi:hypothetical protein
VSFSNPVTGGQGALIRPAIKSPNFVHNVSGWSINRDGSAEFNNGTFRGTVTAGSFQGTDFVINTSGAFFYSGVPAAGNLIASIAPGSGSDVFGNGYLGGFTSYDDAAGFFVNMLGSELVYGPVTAGTPITAGAGTIASSGAEIIVSSPVTVADPSLVSLELDSGAANSAPLGTSPRATFHSSSTVPVLVQAQGAFVAMDPAQLPSLEPYTWQPTSGATNWSVGDFAGTYGALQYRIDNEDNLHAVGAVHMVLAAGLAAGTYTILNAAVPAAYRPAKNWRVVAIHMSSANVTKAPALFTITTGGVFQVSTSTAIAQNDNFYLTGTFPLGNVA